MSEKKLDLGPLKEALEEVAVLPPPASLKEFPEETTDALQAKLDWYDIGPGRSLEKLAALYETREKAGKPTPTLSLSQIQYWSSVHRWREYSYNRLQRDNDVAEAQVVEEMRRQKFQRILEAQTQRAVGTQVHREIMQKIASGDLKKMPLASRMVIPEKGRSYREAGLLDYLGPAGKAINDGQRNERLETGESLEDRLEKVLAALTQDFTPDEARAFKAVARRLAEAE